MIGSAAMSQASSTPLAVTVNHPRCAVARLTCSARLQRTACRIAGVSATFPSPSILESAPRISISGNICQRPVPRRQRMCRAQAEPVTTSTVASPTESGSLAAAELRPVRNADGQLTSFPSLPGVYAVYDAEGSLQFIGLSRKVAVSVANHVDDLPELAAAVKVLQVADTSKEGLTEAWKSWIQEGVAAVGGIPPGNAPGEGKWTRRARTAKPEIKLTPGKGTGDLMVPLEEILDAVVKQNRVVAFIKGTRTAPQCGFSHKVLTILNESRANFEVVNVLDDIHNPGLREVIKTYSQWPTIPQLYVDGELVGGADIIEEMHGNGELKQLLRPAE